MECESYLKLEYANHVKQKCSIQVKDYRVVATNVTSGTMIVEYR